MNEAANRTRAFNTALKKYISVIGGLALIVCIVLQAVATFSFDRNFYREVYAHLGTAETIGISDADLERATAVLLDYIRGVRDDLNVEVTLLADGSTDQMFNEREIAHMVDVKVLYQRAMAVKWASLVLAVATIALLIWRFGVKRGIVHLGRGYKWSLLIFGAFVLLLAAFVLIDFDRFWTLFHHVFFSNDLWILDPATDRMILMVPSYFFNNLVLRIVGGSIGGMLGTGVLYWILSRIGGPRYTGTTDGWA